ncbi:MAG: bifunctional precorrin-2 dehydrogenase/sirohydrochlorin ferrochelatase [Halapricum sp.]
MIPLLHEFSGSRVLVFGGGTVGARKARRFDREAEVIVVAPAFADADFGDASLERDGPDPAEIPEWIDRTDPALVIAATDDSDVNAAAEDAARERGLLINRADHSGERAPGSVVTPATVRADPVVVGVSTQGRAPTVSAVLRDEIEDRFEGAGELATFVGDLRDRLDERDVEGRNRRDVLRAAAESDRVRELLADGDTDRADDLAEGLLADVRERDLPTKDASK